MKNQRAHQNYQLSIINRQLNQGFTLIELIITITILSVLALATVPLVQNAVRRQKEQQLRETLREMRLAIDEFHRDVNGVCSSPQSSQITSIGSGGNNAGNNANPNAGSGGGVSDPRQRVMISDCKIFEADNLDRFPPTLDILAEGVEVTPRGGTAQTTGGRAFGDKNATDLGSVSEPKKKFYLRELPIDPITGESNTWKLRSPYQEKGSDEWDNISVFDVRSGADGETLDGIKYSDL